MDTAPKAMRIHTLMLTASLPPCLPLHEKVNYLAPRHGCDLISRVTLNLAAARLSFHIFPKTHSKFSPFPEMLFYSYNNSCPAHAQLSWRASDPYWSSLWAVLRRQLHTQGSQDLIYAVSNLRSEIVGLLPQSCALLNQVFTWGTV